MLVSKTFLFIHSGIIFSMSFTIVIIFDHNKVFSAVKISFLIPLKVNLTASRSEDNRRSVGGWIWEYIELVLAASMRIWGQIDVTIFHSFFYTFERHGIYIESIVRLESEGARETPVRYIELLNQRFVGARCQEKNGVARDIMINFLPM